MVTITDVMMGKLLVQMKLVPAARIRELVRAMESEEGSVFDIANRLHRQGELDEETVRKVRSYIALYNYVRGESMYLRQLEKRELADRQFVSRLVALIEAECYRRRIGDVLLVRGKITPELDHELSCRVMALIQRQDEQILKRYRDENFKGVGRPLLPGGSVSLKSFRLSSLFRGKQTRALVRKHLDEHGNVASRIEASLAAASDDDTVRFDDFDDVWNMPEDVPEVQSQVAEPNPLFETTRGILMPPAVRASAVDSELEPGTPTVRFSRPPSTKSSVGDQTIGPYPLVDGPEYGAMGQAVYTVQHPSEGESVLQTIDPRVAPAEELARFARQVRILETLDHPGCLRLLGKGKTDSGLHYMVLPVINGPSLNERLAESGPMSVFEAFEVADALLQTLGALHKAELVYRDLRPENVVLLDNATHMPLIVDFRLTWIGGDPSLSDVAQAYTTQTTEALGHPAYLAPESATNDPVDARTDLYSFAIVLFELLTGSRPFRATGPDDYLRQHLVGQPFTLAEARPNKRWSPLLETLLAELLAKNKKDRPESAEVVRRRLRESQEQIEAEFIRTPPPAVEDADSTMILSGVFNPFYKMEL